MLLYLLLVVTFCCLTVVSRAQTIEFGKGYINVTKGQNGGTVETGDILEIRAFISVRAGTFDSCAYYDVIPSGTSYIAGSIRILTNEGKVYKQFTDAMNDDCGWKNGSAIRVNLGYSSDLPADAYRRGRVASNHKPSFYGSSCILVACFRVQVTSALNTNISTGGGYVTYKSGINPIQTFTFPNNTLRVSTNFGFCNYITGTNMIGTEFTGTFGSGKPRNRTFGSTNVPFAYNFLPVDAGTPNEYGYGLSNNTSSRQNYTTLNTWPKPDLTVPSHRPFYVWDIIGDHTGAVSTSAGNPAADTVANSNAGYMLIVNSAFKVDSAFQQTVTGLCPNTYYEISCWIRNLCSKCGCDSNGKGATNSAGPPYYIPTAPGDSSGVYPHLIFEVNGADHYTTGDIPYTGTWVKKGFMYLTGPSQTSFTLKIFNNAPGGGGNDWALDDISVNTCSPDMSYGPTTAPLVCYGNAMTIYDTIWSNTNSYIYYQWQRSTDSGSTWTNVTLATGPATPTWNGTTWQYVASYTVPPTATLLSDSADQYRVQVSTTAGNLSVTGCRYTEAGSAITLQILDCGIPLESRIISFSGKVVDTKAELYWTVERESEPLVYDVEKSKDGQLFYTIGSVNGLYHHGAELNTYAFTDQLPVGKLSYYRLKIRNSSGQFAYSRTVLLSSSPLPFAFLTVINPFGDQLRFDVSSDRDMSGQIQLMDARGVIVQRKECRLSAGINRFSLDNTMRLPSGMYVLRVITASGTIQKMVVKQSLNGKSFL